MHIYRTPYLFYTGICHVLQRGCMALVGHTGQTRVLGAHCDWPFRVLLLPAHCCHWKAVLNFLLTLGQSNDQVIVVQQRQGRLPIGLPESNQILVNLYPYLHPLLDFCTTSHSSGNQNRYNAKRKLPMNYDQDHEDR